MNSSFKFILLLAVVLSFGCSGGGGHAIVPGQPSPTATPTQSGKHSPAIASLSITLATTVPPMGQPTSIPMLVAAFDANGNQVVGTYPAAVALSDSDASGRTSLPITTVTNSATQLVVRYNGKGVIAVITATSGKAVPGAATLVSSVPSQYTLPGGHFGPSSIVTGPDGALWFTYGGSLGRITTSGSVTYYPATGANGQIIVGPDNNLWFSGNNSNTIYKATTTGTITPYTFPLKYGGFITTLAAGPDGNIWFTTYGGDYYSNAIGKMTVTGTVTMYPLPHGGTEPQDIIRGPDGAMYFSDWDPGGVNINLGRITTTGAITEVSTSPYGLTSKILSADGDIWSATSPQFNGTSLIKITTVGTIVGLASVSPPPYIYGSCCYVTGLAESSDGSLWFSDSDANAIGRLYPNGKIVEYPTTYVVSNPGGLTLGPDGRIWFIETENNAIGAITPADW